MKLLNQKAKVTFFIFIFLTETNLWLSLRLVKNVQKCITWITIFLTLSLHRWRISNVKAGCQSLWYIFISCNGGCLRKNQSFKSVQQLWRNGGRRSLRLLTSLGSFSSIDNSVDWLVSKGLCCHWWMLEWIECASNRWFSFTTALPWSPSTREPSLTEELETGGGGGV